MINIERLNRWLTFANENTNSNNNNNKENKNRIATISHYYTCDLHLIAQLYYHTMCNEERAKNGSKKA